MRSFKEIAECAAVATASLMAYVCAAGTEVVQNGDFEDCSATDQTWGSYAGKDGYSSPGWDVTVHGGIAKPDGTWMNNKLDVGRFALFLQSYVDYTASASQTLVVDEPGTYRISFKWAARPGHTGQSVNVWFDNKKLDTISTTDTSLQYWYRDVEIYAAGSYSLIFEALMASGDVATAIDSVSVRKIVKYTWTGGGQTSSVSDAGNWGGRPGSTQQFNSTDYLVFDKAADVVIDSNVMVDGIQFAGNGTVTFTGSRTVTIERGIISDSMADSTFNCPVAFLGTYFAMQNSHGAVKFPGGVTAKYPDATLRTIAGSELSRTLQGDFTFTEDWTAALCGTDADRPWTVPAGSTVHGQLLTGLQTSHRSFFRLDEGASAYFSCVTNGWDIGDIDIDGYLEVSGEMIVQTYNSSSSNESHFGRRGNVGTLKANRIAKSGHSIAGSYIPNLVVGSGGMGALVQDYYWRFMVDTTLTATADFNFLGLQLASNHSDWGINFNTHVTLTVNVPEGIIVTCGIGIAGEGSLRKTGAGTLVMTDTFMGVSDYIKNYGTLPALTAGTFVDEGLLRVEAAGQLGSAPVQLAEGTVLKIAPGVSFTNRIVGEGTVQLANGVTLANGGAPWNAATVEFATAGDAVTVTAPEGIVAPFTFLTGVNAADLSHFSYAGGTLTVKGGALMLADSAAATDYVWNGGANGDWATADNWLVGGAAATAAPGTSDTIRFENDAPVTVTGTSPLSVTKIVTSSGALVTFDCPVAFIGTYNVLNAATAPNFAGGATATVPDDSLTEANMPSHELRGNITFTADWTIPVQPSGKPFVLTAGSTLTGRILSGVTYDNTNPVLRIDDGAVATFDSVDVAGKLVFFLNGGNLVSIGDITTGGVRTPCDFGYYGQDNVGTVEARGIYKSVTGYGNINIYTTNMVVGAGGFGMYRKDYAFVLCVDAKLTAKDDFTIYQPVAEDGPKEGDWGLNMNGYTFTLDTAGHTVVFDSYVNNNASVLIKNGEGEMIMQSRQKQHTGGTILNAGLTTVKMVGALGYGLTTVNDGATLVFSDAALTHAYPIAVNAGGTLAIDVPVGSSSSLKLAAGATLRPVQNTYFEAGGGVRLPGSGTVLVDMTGFTFVNGIANPVLGGVKAGDEVKFTAVVPAGVDGAFSVSDGFLYFTSTSGGDAAVDLVWNPVSDPTWSIAVAAWLNPQNEQVAFSPYANATISRTGTIALPADVVANNVTIETDGDVTLNGAGKLGGPGTIVKKGEGTFTFNSTGGLDTQPIIVSNGVFRIGEDLHDDALGSAADSSPLIVANGATLDINFNVDGTPFHTNRNMVTRNKLITAAGDGYGGQGAIVNNRFSAYDPIANLVLEGDTSVGGTARFDVRGNKAAAIGYARNSGSIYGPGSRLTVRNTSSFGIVYADVTLGSLYIVDGGKVQVEGTGTRNIADGIHLADGNIIFYGATFDGTPVVAESGANTFNGGSGTPTMSGAITIKDGATLTHTGGSAIYTGAINGPIRATGGTMFLNGSAQTSGLTVAGAKSGEIIKMRQSGTYTGANIVCTTLGMGDVANVSLDIVFKNSTIDVNNFMVGWGLGTATALATANISVGEGTTVITPKVAIGDDGVSISNNVKTVLSVDGGTLSLTNNDFFVAYNGPNAEFQMNSGVANVDKATIWLRRNNQSLGGYNKARFIQNGGTFNYGGSGFQARYEDNTDGGQIVLKGGEFNATANWSIPHFISTFFKPGDVAGWTLNQADGTTATWTTALFGNGNVTLNGAATLVGDKEMQGAIGGKWTVGNGFTAGLEGAASFLGGLSLGEGATATIDVAAGRNAVFTARDFTANFGQDTDILHRFNKKIGATTRGTITHDETHLFTHYAEGARPYGNMNYSASYAAGQFYVEERAAGTWTFQGKCDDYVQLIIDGETVMQSASMCATVNGTKELTAGWHSFRHVIADNGGGYGADSGNAFQTLGYKYGSMGDYARFNVKNLKMRPAADLGDPNNANTIRWSHYKGTSATVTASTYKNDEFEWDFCCITNNLQYLQWYGSSDATWFNTYTVNRYEGWFFVTEENADKEWTFRSNYDDRCALWIDGVDSGLDGNNGSTLTYTVALSRGWHSFRVQTADFTGNAGPWSGNGFAISYQIDDGAQTFFGTDTLDMTVCPDGFIQGEVALASNARLANNVAEGAAEVYGTFKATGTGATVSGPFKFKGAKLAYANVAPATRDLTKFLGFENAAGDMLAELGGIDVDFASEPSAGTITVCPAYGLTSANLAANVPVAVTVNGAPYAKQFKATVKDGNIAIVFRSGSVLFFR
jgi:hypothetical protein